MNSLTILPTLFCKYNCAFCYNKLYNKSSIFLDIDFLKSFLVENGEKFDKIIISGGEPFEYPKSYFDDLINVCKSFCKKVVINTFPVSMTNYRDDVDYLISYDFISRPNAYAAWQNMLNFPKKFDVNMILTPQIFKLHPNNIFRKLLLLKNINSIELISFINVPHLTWKISQDFCDRFMKVFISSQLHLPFINVNREKINILNGIESSYEENDYNNYCLLPDKKLYIESSNNITGVFEYKEIKKTEIGILKPKIPYVCDLYSPEIIKAGKINV